MSALAAVRLAIARAPDRAAPLVQAVRAAGGHARALQVLDILPPDNIDAARAALAVPARYTIVTSRSAVEAIAQRHPGWTPSGQVLAVGSATAAALEAAGLGEAVIPSDARTEGLLALPGLQSPSGVPVSLIKGAGGRATLGQTLRARGAVVTEAVVYQRAARRVKPQAFGAWLGDANLLLLPSAEAAAAVWAAVENAAESAWRARLAGIRLLVPSTRVAKQAAQLGFAGAATVTDRFDLHGMIGAIEAARRNASRAASPPPADPPMPNTP